MLERANDLPNRVLYPTLNDVIQAARPLPPVRPAPDTATPRVLVVGDADLDVAAGVEAALPAATVTPAATVFDAIVLLAEGDFDAVLAHVEPFERRPEAAVRALRDGLGTGGGRRLVLFGAASLEPLGRRMRESGSDEFLTLPADAAALRRALSPPAAALTAADDSLLPDDLLSAGLILDALLERTGGSLDGAVQRLDARIDAPLSLRLLDGGTTPARDVLTVPLRADSGGGGATPAPVLALQLPAGTAEPARGATRRHLARIAAELAKLAEIDQRQGKLQEFAFNDELTGCYNRRYFHQFLGHILTKARRERFPVTLLLFDIDDFKHYNDRHGHALGDEILRQSSALIRRVVRDHDLVARIGGDEFAVVFWEKDAPRVPHDPDAVAGSSGRGGRFPQGPLQIAARFRRLLAEPDFAALGQTGEGSLTISGGMAVYPFDAQTGEDLIAAADKALMFGAKRTGKNSIALVGDDEAM